MAFGHAPQDDVRTVCTLGSERRARDPLADAAELVGHRGRARLYRAPVPRGDVRGPHPPRRPPAPFDLSALARDLLHVVDVLRLGRARLAHRLRLPDDLHRSGGDAGARLSADPAHRAARQGAEHHLDRRLHRRALRQAPGGGGDRCLDRHHRFDPLHRAAAQGGVVFARRDPRPHRGRDRRDRAGARRPRAVHRAHHGGVRHAVRHPPHRRRRAPGRLDARNRNRVDHQANRLCSGRGVRHLRDVRRPVGAVSRGDGTARYRQGAHHRAHCLDLGGDDPALVRRDRAAAAPVPRHRGREPQRRRGAPRRLAVPALPGADQPLCGADRDRRPAHVRLGRHRQRHVRARAAAARRLRSPRVGGLHRRALGRDRDGDRRNRSRSPSWRRTTW